MILYLKAEVRKSLWVGTEVGVESFVIEQKIWGVSVRVGGPRNSERCANESGLRSKLSRLSTTATKISKSAS